MRKLFWLGALLMPMLVGCGGAKDVDEIVNANTIAATEAMVGSETSSGNGIPFASDPNATFEVISSKSLLNGKLEVVTKRVGPSGTSFARREISCEEYSYRYLGEGDSLEEAMQDGPNRGEMSALTGTSASSDVANEACKGQ
jgi:hypothetical protein